MQFLDVGRNKSQMRPASPVEQPKLMNLGCKGLMVGYQRVANGSKPWQQPALPQGAGMLHTNLLTSINAVIALEEFGNL